MGNGGVPEVGLLDSDNYWEWSTRMEDLLIYKDLADCLTRDGAGLVDAAQKLADRKALSLIRSHVSTPLLPYMYGKQTAKAAWDTLQALHASSLDAKKSLLEEQLVKLSKAKTENVAEYCARAQKIRLELAAAGEPVSDERLIRAILRGLPDEYKHVTELLLFQPGQTVEKVMTHLRIAEERVIGTEEDATALKAASRRSQDLSKVRCFNCNRFGHIKRDCPQRSGGPEGFGRQRKGRAKALKDAVAMSAVGETAGGGNSVRRDKEPTDAVAMAAVGETAGGGNSITRRLDWIVDSGASHHILADEWAAEASRPTAMMVKLGDGSRVQAHSICSVRMTTRVGQREVDITLSDVLIVPHAEFNLLSVGAAMAKGVDVETRSASNSLVIKKGGKVVGVASRQDGLPVLHCIHSAPSAVALAVRPSKADVWHQRLGHLSYGTMARMVKDGAVSGLDVSEQEINAKASQICEVCIKAKQAAATHQASTSRAAMPLELVHSDLMGPFRPMSAGGNLYLLTAMDDHSGFAAVRPLKHKSEASGELKKIIKAWERQLDRRTKVVRTDRGKEYAAFDRWCDDEGIRRERSTPYTPKQNGRAERLNRTLTERVRAMLGETGLPKKYWAEAFATAAQLYNLSPRMKGSQTPHEKFLGIKPDIQDLRVFGCKTHSHLSPTQLTKLGNRSEPGRLLGMEPGTKGWRILLDSGNVVIRRTVTFDEGVGRGDTADDEEDEFSAASQAAGENEGAAQADAAGERGEATQADAAGERSADTARERSEATQAGAAEEQNEADEAGVEGERGEVQVPAKRVLPPRLREPSKRLKDAYALLVANIDASDEPATLEAALQQPDGDLWRQAADEEMKSLQQLDVYELADLPKGQKLLKNKWVLKRKRSQEGLIERYKARLVAKGFTQTKGVDYDEVFAPVARHATLRALLALAAVEDLEIEQVDVKTAFLNGPLEEDLYMEAPPGYDFGGKVLKLKKALYGLKQAARAWNQELVRVLARHGFEASIADASLFVLMREGRRSFLLVYVDDGLAVGNKADVCEIIRILEEKFDIRRLGAAAFFLGLEIVRDRQARTILLSQQKYVLTILEKTGLAESNARSTPMPVNLKLSKEGDDYMEHPETYAETLGMLLYLSPCTRPDLAFSVGLLARFMA